MNKENEVRAIMLRKQRAKRPGKLTTFTIRGHPIDYKIVVRYWERKVVRIEDVVAQRSESLTPETVDCFISPPSSTPMPEPMKIPE